MKLALLAALLSLSGSTPPALYVSITEHDATGRARTATATLDGFNYGCASGSCVLAVEYTTDQEFCSAFGP